MVACREKYKNGETFLTTFNPDEQTRFCKDLRRVYMGTAPSLTILSQSFGDATAESWLEIQLYDLSEFSGCKDKLTTRQLEQIAKVIISQYGHLKVTELMHFFLRFKAGKFGRFYGAVDGLVITEALQTFLQTRAQNLDYYRREEEKERREQEEREHEKHCMTYEEWQELKWLFNMGYEPWRIKAELAAERAKQNK